MTSKPTLMRSPLGIEGIRYQSPAQLADDLNSIGVAFLPDMSQKFRVILIGA